jgi:hypothetical protein
MSQDDRKIYKVEKMTKSESVTSNNPVLKLIPEEIARYVVIVRKRKGVWALAMQKTNALPRNENYKKEAYRKGP